MVHALQSETVAGALQDAWVWCARLWARVILNHGPATASPSVRGAPSHPAAKAEAVDCYVRCA